MNQPWTSRSAPGVGHRARRAPSHHAGDPGALWMALIAECRACGEGELMGPGRTDAVLKARAQCVGAAFPVEGEDARAASNALLELTRTWPKASPDRRGWHAESVLVLAKHCEVLIEQQANARLGRMLGEREED